MKGFARRLWAFTLVLVMLVGLLPVVQFTADAATVEYRYSDDENQYIYNWGTREVEATFLSPNAEAFYTNNSTSYDALAALQGDALYTALQTLMTDNHEYVTSYDATRDLFQYTDCQENGLLDNTISSFYSGAAIGPAWDSGTTWNREHTWPKSKTDTPKVTGTTVGECADLMSLRPTAASENSDRDNTAYGESEDFYNRLLNRFYELKPEMVCGNFLMPFRGTKLWDDYKHLVEEKDFDDYDSKSAFLEKDPERRKKDEFDMFYYQWKYYTSDFYKNNIRRFDTNDTLYLRFLELKEEFGYKEK